MHDYLFGRWRSTSKKTTRLIREQGRRQSTKKENDYQFSDAGAKRKVNEWGDLIGGNTRHPALFTPLFMFTCVVQVEHKTKKTHPVDVCCCQQMGPINRQCTE
jgi:hypothetical protein